MPCIVITGANRGLGEAFVKYYAAKPEYKVFGIARNKKSAEEQLEKDGIKNVTILHADITNSKSMLAAADEVSNVKGGTLDILIPNAGIAGEKNRWKTLPEFPSLEDMEGDLNQCFRVNAIGTALTIAAFLPLIRKGQTKKIVAVSSAMGLDSFTNDYTIPIAAAYSVSKAALNSLIAKYNAALKSEGILIFGISPGYVATDMNTSGEMSESDMKAAQAMGASFMQYKPDWNGQILTAEQSIEMVTQVIDKATIGEMGGDMVSQHGNKDWL